MRHASTLPLSLIVAMLALSTPAYSSDHHPQTSMQERKVHVARLLYSAVSRGINVISYRNRQHPVTCELLEDALRYVPPSEQKAPDKINAWFDVRCCRARFMGS